ncbi:MAG: hypothetical protein PHE55_02010 [Methylococcaceae bacterium]|nr:hypothetical protein [Methylococcaceae bacterium]
MLKGFIGVVTVCYPFLVYFTFDTVQPRYLALILIVILLLRGLYRDKAAESHWIILAPAAFLLATGLSNDQYLLLGYPIFVSLSFFAWFFYSFLKPPTIVEKLARLQDPDLPPRGVSYTRKVTLVWCAFFLINGSISAATVWYGDRGIWSLYNGLIAYVLMGILMGGEMCIRRHVRKTF